MQLLGVPPLAPSADLPKPDGQVLGSTTFGIALTALAKSPDVRTILELGTWRGGGSSTSLALGLRDADAAAAAAGTPAAEPGLLVTVEAEPEMHKAALSALAGLPVRLLLGSTVPLADLPTADAVAAAGGLPGTARADWEGWLAGERATTARYTAPLLPSLCADYDFDAVLIDAGEFMGDAEWRVVQDTCRPRYVALHDTNTYKTKHVLAELLVSPAWELVGRGDPPAEAAGWAIFKFRGKFL